MNKTSSVSALKELQMVSKVGCLRGHILLLHQSLGVGGEPEAERAFRRSGKEARMLDYSDWSIAHMQMSVSEKQGPYSTLTHIAYLKLDFIFNQSSLVHFKFYNKSGNLQRDFLKNLCLISNTCYNLNPT